MNRQWLFFLRQQQLYLAVATMVCAIFWALGLPVNPIVTLIYSVLLGNMATICFERLYSLYGTRPFPYNWLAFLVLLAATR